MTTLLLLGLLLTSCTTDACSDDPCVLGNETLAWDPAARAGIYEVWLEGGTEPCLTTPWTSALVAGTPCVAPNDTAVLRVRACNLYGCGEFSDPVSLLPYVCIVGNAEVPCYENAPDRLPGR